MADGWKRIIIPLVAGLLTSLSMAPFDLFFLPFFMFPVLVWLLDGAASDPAEHIISRFWSGFKPGFWFGFGYFVGGIWWVGSALLVEADEFAWALPLAVFALPAVLACFWGSATGIARIFWAGNARRLFLLAACFAIFEYLRGHVASGLPWNSISYAAYFTPVTMQSASVLGIYGMTAFAVFTYSALGIIVPSAKAQTGMRIPVLGLALVFVISHVGFGIWRLPDEPSPINPEVTMRLVQPNIAQADKWQPEKEAEIFNKLMSLSTSQGPTGRVGLSGTKLLIWPEAAFPFILTERRDALSSIAAMLPPETTLLTGALRVEAAASGDGRPFVFNSVYAVDTDGEIVSASDKVHLVPFGEYLPFQDLAESVGLQQLTQLKGGFEPGSRRQTIFQENIPGFLPLVCYEIIFSGDLFTGQKRPEWILNLTNDAWFGNTPGPYQHARQARLRSVEEGLPLVRAANSGISGVFDAYGRQKLQLSLSRAGVLDAPLPMKIEPTIHARYGWIINMVVAFSFLSIGLIPKRKPKNKIQPIGR